MIEIQNLSKQFSAKKIIKDINIKFAPGELCFLCGENGAGKSTLLKCIAGMLRPSTGSIKINIDSELLTKRELWKNLGYAGTEPMLYEDLTVLENLKLTAELKASNSQSGSIDDELSKMLSLLGLELEKNKLIRSCSSGLVKRTSLARALLFSPKIILLDEPFVNLDENSRQKLFEIIQSNYHRGAIQIIVSHDQASFPSLLTRQVTLAQGRLSENKCDNDVRPLQ
jgi:ABC-type multidrug transport system ATPase subunit